MLLIDGAIVLALVNIGLDPAGEEMIVQVGLPTKLPETLAPLTVAPPEQVLTSGPALTVQFTWAFDAVANNRKAGNKICRYRRHALRMSFLVFGDNDIVIIRCF